MNSDEKDKKRIKLSLSISGNGDEKENANDVLSRQQFDYSRQIEHVIKKRMKTLPCFR